MSHIENLDDYDVIFVGYPTWWADMPQVLYSFFDEYDFTGKTIVPFNVHNGSRLSRTVQTIQELEPGAEVAEDAFTISEHEVENAAGEVDSWLEGLGYWGSGMKKYRKLIVDAAMGRVDHAIISFRIKYMEGLL